MQQKNFWGNSLAVQWLGLSAFPAKVRVRSLVGEIRILQAAWHGQKNKKKFLNLDYFFYYR